MKILDFNDYLSVLESQELSETLDFNDEIESIEEVDPVEMVDISLDGNNVFYANDILIHNCAINKIDGVDNSMVADSYSTNATADFMIFLLQTEDMKQKSEMLCKVTKNRYTGITDSFIMNIDYPKMRFSDIEENKNLPENSLIDFKSIDQKEKSESYAKTEIAQINKSSYEAIKKIDKENEEPDIMKILGL